MLGVTIPTQAMKFSEARPRLSELLNRVFGKEVRIVIKKGGLPVAAIVSIDDLARLNQLEARRDADVQVLDEIGAAFADQTPEQIGREVARAFAQTRAEERARRQMRDQGQTAGHGEPPLQSPSAHTHGSPEVRRNLYKRVG